MSVELKGKHLIAGDWVGGEESFANVPFDGAPDRFAEGTPEQVALACEAAEEAFWSYGYTTRAERAAFLREIADQIEARADAITPMAMKESGLPEARLQGERGRTTGQLRLFADHIEKGDYLDRRHDMALPDRQPLPRPDIRLIQRPIGPVAVFGASNFPLAFSTAGGDTASALAAGCPVVVKGHPAHPGTTDIVAQAIDAAIRKCGIHPGVFSVIQGSGHQLGAALVQHPLIKAVGFTGSLRGGKALFDLCMARPEPIPFYGELGSVNPMFVLPEAAKARGAAIGEGWAGSLTMGAGQFCTNPGIAVVRKGADGDAFVAAATDALTKVGAQKMLTDGIAAAYRDGVDRFDGRNAVTPLLQNDNEGRTARPALYEIDAEAFLADHTVGEEVFGPLGVVVRVEDTAAMETLAKGFEGQLTATLQMDEGDMDTAARLLPILERKAGRVLANGFPTGVEVSEAMVHGGPYPASTNFGATSVGTMAIRRFLRPVSYQNMPVGLLPEDLQ
ncbi:aldehyde dehydrogenase (NADP(+)) [Chachezhania sediminis]|uniref:aldehyde dehydrogenase (NADP(+)) n=1 Tax=Chachezhania sediminis TaxID=2599291 RepID=UPI00131AC962|nr:aldehyde dehydrogenase (NADP(+)) [Chachezhania sediminis]